MERQNHCRKQRHCQRGGECLFPGRISKKEFLSDSETHTVCHWKGTASYYNLKVDGKENPDAVWYYPTPSGLANSIKGRVAFWKGVQVIKD